MSDFLIIGAGVIGLTSALELQRRGAKVTLVDEGGTGHGASTAGAGILSALLPWNYADAVTRLCDLGDQLHAQWAQHLSNAKIDLEYRKTGMLVLRDPDSIAAQRWCREHGVAHDAVLARDKTASLSKIEETALWLPDVAQIRPSTLVQGLRYRLEQTGCKIMEHTSVKKLHASNSAIMHIETARGHLVADHYIVAAGAWSSQVLGKETLKLQIRPMRGQMLLFDAAPGLLDTIVYSNGKYLVPRKDGRILAGSTVEDVGFDAAITESARKSLMSFATGLCPQLTEELLLEQWAGLRPGSPDNVPTIDRHPRIKNLWINSGHFRYGLTMAPASAEILANKIYGLPQPFDVTPYSWPQ